MTRPTEAVPGPCPGQVGQPGIGETTWIADPGVGAIVLAAGSGRRFGTRKQFAMVGGARLVDRAVALATIMTGPPVLALPPGIDWDGAEVAAVTGGGHTRVETLGNALAALDAATGGVEIVLVHDAARPLATPGACTAVLQAVLEGADAAVGVWPTPDTIKAVHDEHGRILVDGGLGRSHRLHHHGRDGLVVAQSPMAYRVARLRQAMEEIERSHSAAVEETIVMSARGATVVGVPGDPWSHHVVEPRDLELVEAVLAADLPQHRWWKGFGSDHASGAGRAH